MMKPNFAQLAMRLFVCLFALAGLAVNVSAQAPPSPPFTQCPVVGINTSCAVLIYVDPSGTVTLLKDPNPPNNLPYDDSDDTLVGILNNSNQTITALQLTGSDIFGFDDDGICTTGVNPPGCPFPGTTGYEGPGVSFVQGISTDTGTVVFSPGIKPGGSAFFGLEGTPAAIAVTQGPSLSTLSPASIAAGSATFSLTITGNQFAIGDQVVWTPSTGQPTTLTPTGITPNQITVQIPGTLVVAVSTAAVTVMPPSGQIPVPSSNAVQFAITQPPPALTALSPPSAIAGGATFTLTITGANFGAGTQVQWTSASAQTTTLTPTSIAPTQLTVNIDSSLIASAGTSSVAVVLPVTGSASLTSNSLPFSISTLAITSISPASASAFGSDTPVTISGTGFQSGAQIVITGAGGQTVQLTNVTVTPTQITATLPASALSGVLSGVGTDTVTVREGSATTTTNINIAPPSGQSVPSLTIQLASQPKLPTDQPTLTVTAVNSTAASNFVATLALTFTPNASNLPNPFSNPGVSFSTGKITLCVPVPAGPTSSPITIDLSNLQGGKFSQGTVAGIIQIVPHLYYGASCTSDNSSVQGTPTELTPASQPYSLTVAAQAPVFTSNPTFTNVSSSGFNIELNAYSTTRELTTVNFAFTAASGAQLTGTTTFNGISVGQPSAQWFSSNGSLPTGGAFHLTVPFTYTGNTSALGSVAVTLANSAGSNTATGTK